MSQSLRYNLWKMTVPVTSVLFFCCETGWNFLKDTEWFNSSVSSTLCCRLKGIEVYGSSYPRGPPGTEIAQAGVSRNDLCEGCFIERDWFSICLCWKSQSAGCGAGALSQTPLADQWFIESIKTPGWPSAQFPQMKSAWQGKNHFLSLATTDESVRDVTKGLCLGTLC